MFKKPPYGTKISPACAYCTHGSPAADQKMVLCKNRGVVSPYFACRKFRYDPLLRVPHRQELPHYDPKEFQPGGLIFHARFEKCTTLARAPAV